MYLKRVEIFSLGLYEKLAQTGPYELILNIALDFANVSRSQYQ